MLWQRVERKRPGAVSRGTYILLPENYDNLRHAFNQFKGIEHPHNFDSVLSVVSYFMSEYLKGDVIWDHNQLAWKSGGVTKGTYAAECALGMQGFGSYPYAEFPIFLSNAKKRVDMRPISLHPKITEPTPDELVRIKGDFYMTTPERSIIDLLRVYPQSEFVTQALQRIEDYTKLRDMADKYGVRDVLEEEIEYALNAE